MIVGVGTDIVSVNRISKIMVKRKESFLNRVLTKKEIENLADVNSINISGYVANRFAAKEAFSKAMGTGVGKDVSFKDIEVLKTSRGKPYFEYSSKLKEFFAKKYGDNVKTHLSMSNEKEYAQAFVVIEL